MSKPGVPCGVRDAGIYGRAAVTDSWAGVLSGAEVESLDNDHLEAAILTATVFARISPDQKSRIVKVAHRTGKDVAFLGDGVNDAVALHHADVGISPALPSSGPGWFVESIATQTSSST